MRALTQRAKGIFCTGDDGNGLLLQAGDDRLFLRFALVVRGSERRIFPALLLDDWGRERKSLDLYRWIYEQGQRYPRAELFGFDDQGRKTQRFLRDLEIFFPYPSYLYPTSEAPVEEGVLLDTLFLPDPDQDVPKEIAVPQEAPWPLRHAAVEWRSIAPSALVASGWVLQPDFGSRSAQS